MKNLLYQLVEKACLPGQKIYLATLLIGLISQGYSQPHLDVSGKVRIETMDTLESGSTVVMRQVDGILAERVLNQAITEYFVSLPNGIQFLLDLGETPANLINAGADPNDLIGKKYDGGFIFYIDQSGSGLMAATEDQSTGAIFGCLGVDLTGAAGTAIGTGAQNTLDIGTICGVGTAADLCTTLDLNGHMDWFLPSKDELNLIYQNLYLMGIGNLSGGAIYRTSSEVDANNAWVQVFSGGSQESVFSKTSSRYVRAARAF